MIRDKFTHNYMIIRPTIGDLTGYERGNIMEMTRLLTGADLGYNSRWTIKTMGKNILIHPLNAPHIWAKRLTTLQHVRIHFTPRLRK
ncbi:MAG: hypothetical protein QXU32_00965 [Nitrososphaerales archaeon]